MTAIPVWFTSGNGPFAAVLTPQTVGGAGALSDGSPVTITADLDDIELDFTEQTEDVHGMSTTRANHVITGEDFTITLVEILKSTGTNIAAAQFAASAYFKCVITRGAQAFTIYGIRGGYNEGLKNGKSVGRLPLLSCGIAPGYA